MGKRKNNDPLSRFIAARELARSRSIYNEPIIRVFPRIDDYYSRRDTAYRNMRKSAKYAAQSPKRQSRVKTNLFLQKVLTKEAYETIHDCKKEWSKLLSWRSGRGNSTRRRTSKERITSKRNFTKRDC